MSLMGHRSTDPVAPGATGFVPIVQVQCKQLVHIMSSAQIIRVFFKDTFNLPIKNPCNDALLVEFWGRLYQLSKSALSLAAIPQTWKGAHFSINWVH